MFNPSRPLVISIVFVACVGLVLGLATDVGLFGWALTVVLALYLGVAGIARRTRPRSRARGTAA